MDGVEYTYQDSDKFETFASQGTIQMLTQVSEDNNKDKWVAMQSKEQILA